MEEKIKRSSIFIPRLIIKIIVILIMVNYGWILISKLPIGKISLYNSAFDGRLRMPFGENPSKSYNLSLYDIDAMFASHIISKKAEETIDTVKIILIGDSSIWGFLQEPDQTLTGLLNREFSIRNENIYFYNLGYPSISILKDLLLIDKVREYQPSLIIWFATLESLPNDSQLNNPLIENNPLLVNQLIEKYEIYNISTLSENKEQKTLLNQRRNIANLIDLQLYGIHWNATGIDQEYPENYQKAQRDFEELIETFHGISPNDDEFISHLGLDIIKNGIEKNPDIDFILINEPILISEGINSSKQYDFYYPKWAYDQYRKEMDIFTQENNIQYFDFWDLIPQKHFTNSAIHMSEFGEEIFSAEILTIVDDYLESKGVNE